MFCFMYIESTRLSDSSGIITLDKVFQLNVSIQKKILFFLFLKTDLLMAQENGSTPIYTFFLN